MERTSCACICTSRADALTYSYIRILTERIAGKYQRPTAVSVHNLVCACVFMLRMLNDTPRGTDLLETMSARSFPELNGMPAFTRSTDSPLPGPQLLRRSSSGLDPPRLGKSRRLSFLHFQLLTRREANWRL